MNEQVTVALPAVSSSDFTHFVLYYRIYVSYLNLTGFSLSASNLRDINPALYSDYTYLSFYTSTSTTTTVNIASVMTNRNYQPLYFENSSGDISSGVLTSPGIQIQLHFPQLADQSNPPYLSLPGNSMMKLKRSNGGGAFTPIPQHRYFLNNDELNSDGNINTTVNADVAAPNVSGGSSNRYAYVAMYIATAGINEQTYTPIFSIPSFVGIFFLPNN
ncbi:MAG: hypothetical protein LBO80_00790 [Treponema sp.]|nr:hypothetical protein [Treponema sp.]